MGEESKGDANRGGVIWSVNCVSACKSFDMHASMRFFQSYGARSQHATHQHQGYQTASAKTVCSREIQSIFQPMMVKPLARVKDFSLRPGAGVRPAPNTVSKSKEFSADGTQQW